MQSLWRLKLDWDEALPSEINTRWNDLIAQLPLLNGISFKRQVLHHQPRSIHLHGFCDASEKAYGACIYISSRDHMGNVQTQLYCAKSRVAPIKNIQTIPRLELCAAVLLSHLYETVKRSIQLDTDRVFLWTDSTITMHWINTSPHILKTFVANRVADIRSKTEVSDWRHVSTNDNPADLLSRGVMPQDFTSPLLWREGPHWLSRKEEEWPRQPTYELQELLEKCQSKCLNTTSVDLSFFQRFSSYSKLRRIFTWCLRWKYRHLTKGSLTVDELQRSDKKILQLIQAEFKPEMKDLQKGRPVHNKSRLLPLNPFLDGDQIIRVYVTDCK